MGAAHPFPSGKEAAPWHRPKAEETSASQPWDTECVKMAQGLVPHTAQQSAQDLVSGGGSRRLEMSGQGGVGWGFTSLTVHSGHRGGGQLLLCPGPEPCGPLSLPHRLLRTIPIVQARKLPRTGSHRTFQVSVTLGPMTPRHPLSWECAGLRSGPYSHS